ADGLRDGDGRSDGGGPGDPDGLRDGDGRSDADGPGVAGGRSDADGRTEFHDRAFAGGRGGGGADRVIAPAERTMIEMAGQLPAYQLRRVGERILAYVAPELAERADEAALNRQEARARRRRGLTLSTPVDGLVRLSGALGLEDAATVQAALHP